MQINVFKDVVALIGYNFDSKSSEINFRRMLAEKYYFERSVIEYVMARQVYSQPSMYYQQTATLRGNDTIVDAITKAIVESAAALLSAVS